ncbi:hypothetical protein CHISP_2930 [Chitinispirillum alkaliphilum]|nr:hypothetical protein CHISP_2930 [Chitinispirillum alkaliphilum]
MKQQQLPKLLLHICCAPDEAYVINLLGAQYQLHCFFFNPNIYPAQEYELRVDEARRAALHFGTEFSCAPYEPQLWERAVDGLKHTPEGTQRCRACFLMRLRHSAKFCSALGWDNFTTVMSVSPHKNIKLLNETGNIAAAEYNVSYEPFNFKKQNGFQKSIELSKELGLYRQNYCGCELSLNEAKIREIKRRNISNA